MNEYGHGHSVAAWTGVGVLIVASTFIAVGIFFSWMWVVWTGVALTVVGIAAWVGLNAAGYGQDGNSRDDDDQHDHDGASRWERERKH